MDRTCILAQQRLKAISQALAENRVQKTVMSQGIN